MSTKLAFLLAVTVVTAFAVGCSTDHGSGVDDAGIIVPDSARRGDALFAVDALATATIGTACTADTDCHGTNAMCFNDPNFGDFVPGGYCTLACDPAMATSCPTGSECQQISRTQSICIATCDPASMTRQCGGRMGYGCSSDPMFSGRCVGGCFDATDCPAGLMCDRMGGQVGSGTCYTPSAMIGIACTTDMQCPIGGNCNAENAGGWPGGACIVPGCDAAANTGCTGNAQCIAVGGAQGDCIQGCTIANDCRVGYTCTASTVNPDRHYCAPACTNSSQCTGGRVCNAGLGTCDIPFAGTIGGACQRFNPMTCAGGTCLSERSSGYPSAMCTYAGCSATEPCPSGGVCAPRVFPSTFNVCLLACSSDTQCRAGYHCLRSNPADPASAMACVPSCATNADCTSMAAMGVADVCNVGTGLCGAPFSPTLLGAACVNDSTCVGGHCATEALSGFAGGMCVYPGCALSGTGGSTCPAASACIDDHYGDPARGVCAPTCTGTTSCRAGYACVATSTSGVSACQPMCTSASCAPGRTCNTTSGLCH